jgi:hypothetical protein
MKNTIFFIILLFGCCSLAASEKDFVFTVEKEKISGPTTHDIYPVIWGSILNNDIKSAVKILKKTMPTTTEQKIHNALILYMISALKEDYKGMENILSDIFSIAKENYAK